MAFEGQGKCSVENRIRERESGLLGAMTHSHSRAHWLQMLLTSLMQHVTSLGVKLQDAACEGEMSYCRGLGSRISFTLVWCLILVSVVGGDLNSESFIPDLSLQPLLRHQQWPPQHSLSFWVCLSCHYVPFIISLDFAALLSGFHSFSLFPLTLSLMQVVPVASS